MTASIYVIIPAAVSLPKRKKKKEKNIFLNLGRIESKPQLLTQQRLVCGFRIVEGRMHRDFRK